MSKPPPLKGRFVRDRSFSDRGPSQRRGPPPPPGRRTDEDDPDDFGPTWVWGIHAALACLANPARKIERVLASRNAALRLPEGAPPDGVELQMHDPASMDGMLPPGAVHQGLAVRAWPLEPWELSKLATPPDGRPVLVLDQITDPQNVGALFRSAAAFGARGLVMQDRKSPPLTGALAKAAAGAIETVPHARVANIARTIEGLKNWGYVTVGLEGEAGLSLADALKDKRPAALVLGAEGKGLRELVGETCERRARIPIAPGMDSLNVSVAGAIALYETARKS
ncbi:MAG: 23S rRNA (guanosine(2251)-2'-O)-methyltransferase RlmB [Caulobacterales bacterium]